MTTSFYAQFLSLHKEAQRAVGAALTDLGQRIGAEIQHITLLRPGQEAVNEIDRALEPQVLQAVKGIVQTFYLGESRTPVLEQGGQARPNSPFVNVIWPYLHRAAQIATARQRAIIEHQFSPYPDVWAAYQPFYDKATSVIVQELDKTFDARLMEIAMGELTVMEALPPDRPVATYDPVHRWVKPDGYRLSDRIWLTDEETRRRLDLYVSTKIREGISSSDLAYGVVQFLQPGQYLPETNKPYGRNLSYNTMRLARTEISAAYAQADIAAARANPLIVSYNAHRTRYGKPCAICDPAVDASPYDIQDVSGEPPFHPHCLCRMTFNYQESIDDTVERLRAELRDKHPDLFDSKGLMGLADRVRVNTSKWIPGQLTSPDPQLVRSTLAAETLPLQTSLEKGFSGAFTGDLYYMNARDSTINGVLAGTREYPRYSFGSHQWHPGGSGLSTTYRNPASPYKVMRFSTEGLQVGSRAMLEDLIEQASVKATELWGKASLVTMDEYAKFSTLVAEQLELLARGQGLDAFVWAENSLHIVSWEKVRFAQAYGVEDLTALRRGEMVFKPLAEAMTGAAERFAALHESIESFTSTVEDLRATHRELGTAYRAKLRESKAAYDAYMDARLLDPDSELTRQLKATFDALDRESFDLLKAKGAAWDALRDAQRTHGTRITDLLPHGDDMALKAEYQRGYKSGSAKKKWDSAFEWVSETVNGDIYDQSYTLKVTRIPNSERATGSGRGINLAPNDPISTAIHEIGHAIEDFDPYTHQRCVEFLHSRTNPANVKYLGSGYRVDEVADPDNFWSPYIGKIYGNYDNPRYTEILSMGLERLYYDPVGFYQTDPEYFDFIVGLIIGWI